MLVFEQTRLLTELRKKALDNKPTADLMPFSDLKPLTAKYVYKVWQKEWDETGLVSNKSPEGRQGMSDVSPMSGISGLSFDSTLLSPLLFFCLVLLPFLSYRFLPAGPFFSTFSRKFFNIFR